MTFSPLFLNFLEFVTGTGACQQACSPLPKKLSKVSSVNRQRLLTTPCSVTSTSTPIGRRMIEADRLQQNAISRAEGGGQDVLKPLESLLAALPATWPGPCSVHGTPGLQAFVSGFGARRRGNSKGRPSSRFTMANSRQTFDVCGVQLT